MASEAAVETEKISSEARPSFSNRGQIQTIAQAVDDAAAQVASFGQRTAESPRSPTPSRTLPTRRTCWH
ncbi:MAG: hypothetical protein IPK29_20085 [Betaproteobacteria bacterium]|nr:hypothetical protein [Betaproteobacteria bacterium]